MGVRVFFFGGVGGGRGVGLGSDKLAWSEGV